MLTPLKLTRVLALVLILLAPAAALAQTTSNSDRLFLSFVEDATIVQNQWWEAQLEFSDFDSVDQTIIRGIVAFQPWKSVEVGGRVGFGSTDTPAGIPDGSGATDLDVWGKYHFGDASVRDTEFAVGGVFTIPTGDDTAGLGQDAFAVAAFGTLRHRLPSAIISAHVGVRLNDDGQVLGGPDVDGENSGLLGVGVIFPTSDKVTFVGELDYEGKRFSGGESDIRVLGGVNWRPFNTGQLRAALAFGLSDGAPDGQLLVGYAANF